MIRAQAMAITAARVMLFCLAMVSSLEISSTGNRAWIVFSRFCGTFFAVFFMASS